MQGDYSAGVADYGTTAIIFKKIMANTDYHLSVTSIWQGTNDDTTWMQSWKIQQNSISTTGFSCYSRSSTQKRFNWSVFGYIE